MEIYPFLLHEAPLSVTDALVFITTKRRDLVLQGDINFRIYHVFCPKSTICASPQDALVSQGMTLSRSEKEISRSIAF